MLTRLMTVGALSLAVISLPDLAKAVQADDSADVSVGTASGGNSGATVDVGAGHSSTRPKSTATGPAGASQGGSSGERECTFNGEEIACTSALGVWSEDRQCFVKQVSPQPAPDHAIWEGREEGTVYQCVQPGSAFSAGIGNGFWFWAPSAGDAGAPVLVDPVTLAEKAIERMDLAAPAIGMTPLAAGAPLLVGMDAWLWIDNAGPHGYGPITRTATAGPVSVTATAEVTKVVWQLGDGTTLTCRSAGTPWSPKMGTGPSPTCGHQYQAPSIAAPNGTFTVRATAHWQVHWTGAGQSGRITFTMNGEREQPVTEVQVLQTS